MKITKTKKELEKYYKKTTLIGFLILTIPFLYIIFYGTIQEYDIYIPTIAELLILIGAPIVSIILLIYSLINIKKMTICYKILTILGLLIIILSVIILIIIRPYLNSNICGDNTWCQQNQNQTGISLG